MYQLGQESVEELEDQTDILLKCTLRTNSLNVTIEMLRITQCKSIVQRCSQQCRFNPFINETNLKCWVICQLNEYKDSEISVNLVKITRRTNDPLQVTS